MNNQNKIGKVYSRPWGTYQTLALTATYQIKIINVNPGGKLSLQKHAKRAENWIVVQGNPTITVDATTKTCAIGDHILIPVGTLHRLENTASQELAVIVEVQIGSYLGEDDIVRVADIYGRNLST